MKIIDSYYKKSINFRFNEQDYIFNTSQSLFSSYDIDIGTQRLLRSINKNTSNSTKKILDLGCGYGPIGIILGKNYNLSTIHMVDTDELAIEYAEMNAKINNVPNCLAYSSLGYDDIKENGFDLIISNIPAKIGDKALKHILIDAKYYLNKEGYVAIVVIEAINEYVSNILYSNDDINVIFKKEWNGHFVYHYKFKNIREDEYKKAFDNGIYDRENYELQYAGMKIPIKTTYNISEFNSLNIETELLLKEMIKYKNSIFANTIFFNAGQGHSVVAFSKIARLNSVELIDRNILALRTTTRNLIENKYESKNIFINQEVGIMSRLQRNPNVIVGYLNDKDNFLVNETILLQAFEQLEKNGLLILTSSSTVTTRIEKYVNRIKNIRKINRNKHKGRSILVLKKRV